jgi:glycosyltransferase involved in cell wall biosynthesis
MRFNRAAMVSALTSAPATHAPRLSVIVIAKDEGRHIQACLESVAFADEWIVVDSGSSDDTVAKAEAFGAQVIRTLDWPGFGQQKNRALAAAQGQWVLSLDADERVTPALAQAIQAAVAAPQADAYSFPRLSSMCGVWIRHGDWFPDHVLRLFRRGQARFSDDLVHERLVCNGRIAHLADGELLHESIPSIENNLQKLDRYTTSRALQQYRAGKRGSVGKAIVHGLWAFLRCYVVRLGFLDGAMGFVVAVGVAEGAFYRYLKLWMLERSSTAATEGQAPVRSS